MPPTSRGVSLRLFKQTLSSSTTIHSRKPLICAQCTSHLSLFPPPSSIPRTFSTSPASLRKSPASKKPSRKSPEATLPAVDQHVPNNKATATRDAEIDPYDHSELHAAIGKAIARLKENLVRTKDAGRVSVQMLEDLPVELSIKGGGSGGEAKGGNSSSSSSVHKETTKLGGIASVVPKGGRSMQIFVSEEAHLKPVMAALTGSDYSLNPQAPNPQDTNQLCVTVPVPPVTAETRAQAAAEAKKVAEKAGLEVRNARGDAQKRHRKMELGKLVVKDELVKAHKGMEEVARKGQEEVKRVLDNALKHLER